MDVVKDGLSLKNRASRADAISRVHWLAITTSISGYWKAISLCLTVFNSGVCTYWETTTHVMITMDDDIGDILASVSAPSIPQRRLDLQAMTRAWVNERTAPQLLPYPTSVVDRVVDRIKTQVSRCTQMWACPLLEAFGADRGQCR